MSAAANLRLTNRDRDGVVSRAIEHGFKARREADEAEEHAIALAAYEDVVPADVRRLLKKLPPEWVRTTKRPSFTFGFSRTVVSSGSDIPVPGAGYGCGTIGVVKNDALIARWQKWAQSVERRKEDEQRVKAELTALLYRANTLNQVREMWPEGEPFYRHLAPKAGAGNFPAPAVEIKTINKALGLPLKEAA